MPSSISVQWLQQWLQTDWLLVTAGVGIVVLGLLFSIRSRRRNQALNAKLQRLERELRAANSSAIGMGQQLIQMEKMLKHRVQLEKNPPRVAVQESTISRDIAPVRHAKQDIPPNAAGNQESSYNQARHYLSQGKSVEETVKACGLSYAEVSLLQAISKQPAPIS